MLKLFFLIHEKLNLMQVKGVEHAVMVVLMLLAYQPLPKLVEKHVGLPDGEQLKKTGVHQLQ